MKKQIDCFKPYYKWITFNTDIAKEIQAKVIVDVLNLIINGLPSILNNWKRDWNEMSF